MDDIQIKCFILAAEKLNFTAVSEEMFFTPQTVSRQIRTLEKELGTELFRRYPNRLELTAAGEGYYQFWNNVKKDLDYTKKNIQLQAVDRGQRLRIAYSEQVDPSGELLTYVKKFQSLDHSIRITGICGDTVAALEQGDADIALLISDKPVLEHSFITIPLAEERESIFLSPWAEENATPDSWDIPLVQSFSRRTGRFEYRYSTEKKLELMGIKPCKIILLPTLQSVIAMMRTTACFGIYGSRFGYLNARPELRKINPPHQLEHRNLCCVWSRNCENKQVPRFAEFLHEAISGKPS